MVHSATAESAVATRPCTREPRPPIRTLSLSPAAVAVGAAGTLEEAVVRGETALGRALPQAAMGLLLEAELPASEAAEVQVELAGRRVRTGPPEARVDQVVMWTAAMAALVMAAAVKVEADPTSRVVARVGPTRRLHEMTERQPLLRQPTGGLAEPREPMARMDPLARFC